MIRNTSPIGWPPLILIKIVKDRSWLPFISSFILVFIPVVFLSVAIDSYFYGEFPVITSLNFMRVNLSEGLSKYYGSFPFHFYIFGVIPLFFTAAIPAVFFGYYAYLRDKLAASKDQVPYMAILSLFYLLIFSLIAHKEVRFMLPIIPFSALMAGYGLKKWAKTVINKRKLQTGTRFIVYIYIFVEVVMGIIFLNLHFRNWEVPAYLTEKDVAPHSVYFMQAVDAPYQIWTHRKNYLNDDGSLGNRTIVYKGNKNPTYARRKQGTPI